MQGNWSQKREFYRSTNEFLQVAGHSRKWVDEGFDLEVHNDLYARAIKIAPSCKAAMEVLEWSCMGHPVPDEILTRMEQYERDGKK